MESAQTQSSGKEKKGLRRVWRRIRDVFRQKPLTTTPTTTVPPKTTSRTEPATTSQPTSDPKPSETPQPQPGGPQEPPTAQITKIEVDDKVDEPSTPTGPTSSPEETPTTRPQQPSNEAEMRFQKAQALFARYNVQLNEADWNMRPREPYERVPKKIRMRVRYTCHHCSTTFGRDRVCVTCQHRCCTRCARYPPRRDRANTITTTAPPADNPGEASRNVEASCHECQTGFELGATECPNCHHRICGRCLQEATITVGDPGNTKTDQTTTAGEQTSVS